MKKIPNRLLAFDSFTEEDGSNTIQIVEVSCIGLGGMINQQIVELRLEDQKELYDLLHEKFGITATIPVAVDGIKLHLEDPYCPMIEFATRSGSVAAININRMMSEMLLGSIVRQVLTVWLEERQAEWKSKSKL